MALKISAHKVDPLRDPNFHVIGRSFLPLLLETIDSPNFKHFTLTIAGWEDGAKDFISVGNDWSECEVQFLRFRNLDSVIFLHSPNAQPLVSHVLPEELYSQLETFLPVLVRKGILRR